MVFDDIDFQDQVKIALIKCRCRHYGVIILVFYLINLFNMLCLFISCSLILFAFVSYIEFDSIVAIFVIYGYIMSLLSCHEERTNIHSIIYPEKRIGHNSCTTTLSILSAIFSFKLLLCWIHYSHRIYNADCLLTLRHSAEMGQEWYIELSTQI